MALWKSKSGRYVHLAVLPQRDITTQCSLAQSCLKSVQCAAHCPSRLGADEDIKILQTRSRPITSMLFLQHIKPVLVHSLSLHLW